MSVARWSRNITSKGTPNTWASEGFLSSVVSSRHSLFPQRTPMGENLLRSQADHRAERLLQAHTTIVEEGGALRKGVKGYVDAQKALMDVMLKHRTGHTLEAKPAHRAKRAARQPKKASAAAAA